MWQKKGDLADYKHIFNTSAPTQIWPNGIAARVAKTPSHKVAELSVVSELPWLSATRLQGSQ
jgi:hypothetical protein